VGGSPKTFKNLAHNILVEAFYEKTKGFSL